MLFTGHARYRRRNLSADLFNAGQRLLGLDLGTKNNRSGAMADTRHQIATPFDTIKRTKFGADAAQLEAVIDAENIGGLVLGLRSIWTGRQARAFKPPTPSYAILQRARVSPTCRCSYGMSVCRPPLSNARLSTPTLAARNAARSSTNGSSIYPTRRAGPDCTPEPRANSLATTRFYAYTIRF